MAKSSNGVFTNRKNEGDDMPKQQAQQTDIAQKAKDLFGEETVHVIDEE